MTANPNPTPMVDANKLGSIKTYMLIAFIFSIIFVIVWLIAALWEIFLFATFSSAFYFVGFFAGIFIVEGVVFLVLFVVALMCFMRIRKMYNAVNSGDIATLKATSNMLWAIITLIFGGVIPGIMLLIADGPIKQL
jgi:putative membrane protein